MNPSAGDQPANRPRIGFLPIGDRSRPEVVHGYQQSRQVIRRLDAEVIESPLVWSQPEVLDSLADLQARRMHMLVVHALHGMSAPQQTLAGARAALPVVFWALPTDFSFPSAANAVGALRERGRPVRLVVSDERPEDVLPQLEVLARAAYTVARLRQTRLGTLGSIFPNLTASQYQPDLLMDRLGPQVVHITVSHVNALLTAVPEDDPALDQVVRALSEAFQVRADEVLLRKAMRLHRALDTLAKEQRLDALVLECHTELTPWYAVNPCLGLADPRRSYLIGCEGDVLAAVNQLLVRYLTGAESYLGDIHSLTGGVLALIHCGADCRLAGDERPTILEQQAPDLVGVSTRLAMCVPQLRPGPVTVTRLHGPDGTRLHVAAGELIDCDASQRLGVRVRLYHPQAFLERVCGNHYLVSYGDMRARLRALGEWLGLEISET